MTFTQEQRGTAIAHAMAETLKYLEGMSVDKAKEITKRIQEGTHEPKGTVSEFHMQDCNKAQNPELECTCNPLIVVIIPINFGGSQ